PRALPIKVTCRDGSDASMAHLSDSSRPELKTRTARIFTIERGVLPRSLSKARGSQAGRRCRMPIAKQPGPVEARLGRAGCNPRTDRADRKERFNDNHLVALPPESHRFIGGNMGATTRRGDTDAFKQCRVPRDAQSKARAVAIAVARTPTT